MKRQVIVVPADDDGEPGKVEYYANFVFRVASALQQDGLEFEMHVVPAKPTSAAKGGDTRRG